MAYLLITLAAGAACALAAPAVARLAAKFGIVDRPDAGRKLHGRVVPLLGGLAVFAGLAAAIIAAIVFDALPGAHIHAKYLIGIIAASFLLVFGGLLDDKYNLKPGYQFVWPLLAALVIIASGIGVKYVTNPFGGQLYLDRYAATVLWWQGIPYRLTFLADAFTVLWLLGMTYTTKFLDGVDGLVSGVTAIGALVIAAVSLMKDVAQPDTALLSFAVAGVFLGFLLLNFQPARIFLGEGGSTLAGFLLGVLAIISGGKIATALLVLGLPLVDAAFVILRRLWLRRSPTAGDRSHLHFRLIELGFSQRQVVLFYYFIAAAFGTATLFLSGREKVEAMGVLTGLLLVILAAGAVAAARKRQAAR